MTPPNRSKRISGERRGRPSRLRSRDGVSHHLRFEELGEESLHDQRRCREPMKVTSKVEERLLGYLAGVPDDYGWDRMIWTLGLQQPIPASKADLSRARRLQYSQGAPLCASTRSTRDAHRASFSTALFAQ